MKFSIFKATIPVEINEIKELLEIELPQYEYRIFGKVGKGLKVRKSMFGGLKVIVVKRRISVQRSPSAFLAQLLDIGKLISLIPSAKMQNEVVELLRERYQ